MKNLFVKREAAKGRKNNLEIPNRNTVKYEHKSIRSLGPQIWNIQKKSKMKILMRSLKST